MGCGPSFYRRELSIVVSYRQIQTEVERVSDTPMGIG